MPSPTARHVPLLLVTLFLSAFPTRAEETLPVRVYAAAGVAEALEGIGAAFTKQTGTKVEITAGGSVALSRQILQGAPADIFVPEGGGVLAALLKVAMVDPDSSFSFATNSLVVAAPARHARQLSSARELTEKKVRRLSLPDTDVVPAGILAKRALINLDLWDRLRDRLRVSPDVKTAMAALESEEADLGIFYVTDVRKNPKIQVVLTLPASSYDPIRYAVALVAHPGASPAARPFLQFLRGPEARQAIVAAGLTPASP